MNDIGQTPTFSASVTPKVALSVNALNEKAPVNDKKVDDIAIVSPKADDKESATKKDSINSALSSANNYVQNIERDLVFSVDEELEQTVIKVVESESGKVIRQIPEDVFLELAKNLETGGDLNLVNASG